MTEQDMQELNAIIQHLGPAIQQAVGNGVLYALRAHSEEQAVELEPLVFGEVHNTKPIDEQVHDLIGEFDARKWAKEFKRLFPASDEGTMLGWFANAIMTGYDYNAKEIAKREACTTQQATVTDLTTGITGRVAEAEVPGEREVWLSTYTAAIRQGQTTGAANTASFAVEVFRERYK